MKKLISILSLLTVVLTSCSGSDDSAEQVELLNFPRKTIDYYQDSGNTIGSREGTFNYNDNKLNEIFYNAAQRKVFTYTGDFITKVEFYEANALRFVENFSYNNGKLVTFDKFDVLTNRNENTVYTHQTDGTVDYIKLIYSSSISNPSETLSGTLFFENGNLVEDVYSHVINNSSTNEINYIDRFYEYDTKINPYKNIKGFSLLIPWINEMNTNNLVLDYSYVDAYMNGVLFTNYVIAKEYVLEYDERQFPIRFDYYTNEDLGGNTLYLIRITDIEY
ncbi:hypothetical protein IVB69_03355 [Flavobacterium sp. J49]|uniref:hypothetical protein n=1 Tax=Flavobacterium sp. J49 TaxID=2718534 RepID=UPI00159390B3|nr:hypothetical protein [Flavobacterium sp. J49]MBF6640507.1 hypothetical protein [Flavobacterium sp. J49]NIC01754.1 hypothetical protein [Flavobacterium sp. J49]